MPKVTFIEFDDTVHTIEAELGSTIMEAALQGGVTSIVAECGGACSCATCHVYIDDAWVDRVGAKTDEEEDQLDTTFDVRPNSRLSCQIKVTEALDGLVLRTPSYQGR
jgi:2Fe-2S ferredoxin